MLYTSKVATFLKTKKLQYFFQLLCLDVHTWVYGHVNENIRDLRHSFSVQLNNP